MRITGGERLECDECWEEKEDVRALQVGPLAVELCPQCRIKAEALLRGARKSGPRIAPQKNAMAEWWECDAEDCGKSTQTTETHCDYCGRERGAS